MKDFDGDVRAQQDAVMYPSDIEVVPHEDFTLSITFDNGEQRILMESRILASVCSSTSDSIFQVSVPEGRWDQ